MQVPLYEDCFRLYALRSNYLAAIWQRCIEQYPDILRSEEGHGWFAEDCLLLIQWMSGHPAPEAVLEFMACKCGMFCELPKCDCLSNGLKCTNCGNMNDEDEDYTMRFDLDDDKASAFSSDEE